MGIMDNKISVKPSFPIVGIGGSAGGLEAFSELLRNIPAEPGMALVFIMHLAPEHKSMLPELLAKVTKMPVSEIKSGMLLKVNHVYVKPPNTNLSISKGKLILSPRQDNNTKHLPIDFFFRSLAEEHGNRGIGVILSGTATDGTLGAEALKAEGGIVFAQDEESAAYDDMPQSAVNAGCVDYVLPPKKIAGELARIVQNPLILHAVKIDESVTTESKNLEDIFAILRSAKNLDFTYYKRPSVKRRVSRRMVLLKLENLRSYLKFLRENKDEVEKLYEDLLINVTSFFRDPEAFHALEKQVLPAVIKNKTKDSSVRIWVPGCSSGEEVYSIAICLIEALGKKAGEVPIQIFATDVSENIISKARRGLYAKNIENNISPERLKRFFTKEGNSYKITKQLRDICVFSKQNVFADPPFSNTDLISCRNLLIYLQPVLQGKVFRNFHYGLRPGGFLLLGNSESTGGYSTLFKTLDRKNRIFVKKYLPLEPKPKLEQKNYILKKSVIAGKADIKTGRETDIPGMVDRAVLGEYASCGVLIDGDMEVVQFRGQTGRYLESAAGRPSLDIFKLARQGLLLPLRAAIYEARKTKHTVKREAADVRNNGQRMQVNITVIPVKSDALKEELFLVLFDELGGADEPKKPPKARAGISLKGKPAKGDAYTGNLQKELSQTKEYLQTIIEEHESAIEELKTANEEIMSSNEELQSTNEELETAKEELQSSNEELITSNEELQNRSKEVSLLNNDLTNLFSSIGIPVIMMSEDLIIRRITSQAEKALNVLSSDVGRSISKIKLNVDIPDLEKTLTGVMESLHPKTLEIKNKEGIWYSVYIRPYRTTENKIDGVVAIFVDITASKKAEQVEGDLAEAQKRSDIFENIYDGIISFDMAGKVVDVNTGYQKLAGRGKEELIGMDGRVVARETVKPEELENFLKSFAASLKGKLPAQAETVMVNSNGREIPVIYSVSYIFDSEGKPRLLIASVKDITERKKAEEKIKAKERFIDSMLQNSAIATFVVDSGHKVIYWNKACEELTGIRAEDVLGTSNHWKAFYDHRRPCVADMIIDNAAGDMSKYYKVYSRSPLIPDGLRAEGWYPKLGGKDKYIVFDAAPIYDADGKVIAAIETLQDLTERKRAEEEIKTSEEKYRSLVLNIPDAVWTTDMNGKTVFIGQSVKDICGYTAEEIYAGGDEVRLGRIHPDDMARVKKAFKALFETGESFDIEYKTQRKDGEWIWLRDRAMRVYEKNGVKYVDGVFTNITERMKVEQGLKELASLKDEFLGITTHELKTPLTPIKIQAEMWLAGMYGKLDQEQENSFKMTLRNAERLIRLIDDVLTITKIDQQKLEFRMAEDNLSDVLQDIVSDMQVQATEKNIYLKFDPPQNLPSVYVDRERLQQAVTNLLNNALKFMEKGGVTVAAEDMGDFVRVSIKDTGIGMAKEELTKIFTRFYQIDHTITRKYRGSGLGLSIVKGIIEKHGGRVWAESEGLDKGTTFYFTLPVYKKSKQG
jgi:two-component system CheB/CheR fusion protein